jgi:leader peptidase (prepilin peptidase)/N-methyltransferase
MRAADLLKGPGEEGRLDRPFGRGDRVPGAGIGAPRVASADQARQKDPRGNIISLQGAGNLSIDRMGDSAALLSSPLAIAAAGLFGALWGSFFNVCIDRIPRGESIVRPGSRCDSCGTPIRVADNLPVISYLLLRGRCRHCRAPFSARHPLVELLAALLAAAIWWRFVASDPGEVAAIRLARFAVYFAFAGTLTVLSFIDLATQLLPDVITLPAIPILFLAAFGAHGAGWLERLSGAAAGYLFFLIISEFYYRVLKREGLGLGDGKLLAMIGAVLGWPALPFVVFVGSFTGAFVSLPIAIWQRRGADDVGQAREPLRRLQIPFGPFLAVAALSYLFIGPALLLRWLGLDG